MVRARKMPPAYKVALYWMSREGIERSRRFVDMNGLPAFFVIDSGETYCFACGWSRRFITGDKRPDSNGPLKDIWANEGLQRCHLVPYAKGGSDEPDNLVLLCQECHKDAPDCLDPDIVLAWIARRGSFLRQIHARMQAAAAGAGLSLDDANDWVALIPDAIDQVQGEAINAPGSNLSAVFGIVAIDGMMAP
jgi:hypothetical protein